MQCPRLDHFVRFNPNGTVSRCGHMISPPQFDSLLAMDNSDWLERIRIQLAPKECVRCIETERLNGTSIRLNAIKFHQQQTRPDYIVVGGVLDNVCNSGCLTCDEHYSTKIGSLKSQIFPIVDNSTRFWKLPTHRIVHLDINGGEPSASKNYRYLLANLPKNVQSIRINTNGSIVIDEIEDLINKGIRVTVTVSLDGVNDVHDYIRWPIKWDKFYDNLLYYKNIKGIDLNTWTTVSALNIHNFLDIKKFTSDLNINHSYALLHNPDPISVKYKNNLTLPYNNIFPGKVAVDINNQTELDKFIEEQNSLRRSK